jgi:hypothetical protein
MTNQEYFAIVVDVFPVPNNPGPSAAVVAGMTASVIAETTQLHREATQVYHTYHNVNQAIKKLIIESFDDVYLNVLSVEIVGYANCTSLQLLTHPLTYYAMISPTELTQSYERLNTPYDPNLPIETLFHQIHDARAFAVAGGQPYGAAMIVNVAYRLVFNTGYFPMPVARDNRERLLEKRGRSSRSISPLLIVNFVSLIRPHSSMASTAPI